MIGDVGVKGRLVEADRAHLRFDFDIQGQHPCAAVGEGLELGVPLARQHEEHLELSPSQCRLGHVAEALEPPWMGRVHREASLAE